MGCVLFVVGGWVGGRAQYRQHPELSLYCTLTTIVQVRSQGNSIIMGDSGGGWWWQW